MRKLESQVNSKDRDEAVKWLRLGYETYGPEGAAAVATAIGMGPAALRAASVDRSGAGKMQGSWTATPGGITLVADESATSQPKFVFQNGDLPKTARPPRNCPPVPPRNDSDWKEYTGDPWWFHCGYDGYVEDRDATPDRPIGECFYDEQGQLVDGNHRYAGCVGTPDSYSAMDPRHWLWTDLGGIWENFGAAGESVWHRYDKNREWLRNKGYQVPPSARPLAPYPY